jgi:hypothetical protein
MQRRALLASAAAAAAGLAAVIVLVLVAVGVLRGRRRAAGEPVDRLRAAPAPPGRPRNAALDLARARALLRTPLRGVREVLSADLPR